MQKRMEEICNPSWMKQMGQISSALQQVSGSMRALPSIQPAVLSSMQSLADIVHPSWVDSIKGALDYSPVLDLVRREQAILSFEPPISALQSALSDYMLNWPSFNTAMQGASLALQKEYAVAHAYTLVNSISSLIEENEEITDEHSAELSDEDKQIIAGEVSSILSSQKNWEQRLMESVSKLREEHPILAPLFYGIILNILASIIISLASIVIGQIRTPAKVYDKPQTTSQVVYHLEPLQQVKIIGEQPYYYQIELTDNDTQEIFVGFVSKRSIQQVDTQDESPTLDAVD